MLDRAPEDKALERVLDSGTSLAGATGGAAVGLAVGGPAGAFAGAGAGWAIQEFLDVGRDVASRLLSRRAEVRVGAVFRMADWEVSARIVNGETPRDDLREETTPGRSAATELVEAALITAAQTHEERKIPYIAHLLAAIVFEPDLTHADANQLIGVVDALTYRQLVILAAYDRLRRSREEGGAWVRLYGEGYEYEAHDDEPLTRRSIRVEMLDLFRRGLVAVQKRERPTRGEVFGRKELPWPALPREISFIDAHLSESGKRLVRMMRLDEVPDDEAERLVFAHIRVPELSSE